MSDMTAGPVSRYAGQRLREEREKRGLSLAQVQERTAGRLRAISTGMRERGDRSISLDVLADYAEFYRTPMASFLPSEAPSLAAEAFAAITAATRLREGALTAEYERQIDDLRERLHGCRCREVKAS